MKYLVKHAFISAQSLSTFHVVLKNIKLIHKFIN